jgi:pyruvyl transferase EpsO
VEAAESLIARLNERIETALRPLIPAGHPVALIGFPSHANVGDSAIWLGETTYLRRHRNRIVYVCDPWSYSRAEAERRQLRRPVSREPAPSRARDRRFS